ncbi:MAG: hypothetical protein U0234_20395 [Sandaracinus sp.]
MSRATYLSLVLALAASHAGCTALIDAERHARGSDTGARDGGTDGGPIDGGRDAGPVDANIPDVGLDAGPTDCTTDIDCPASVSTCVSGHCTVCAPSSPTSVLLQSDPGLGGDVDLTVGVGATAREILVAWRGAGTRVYLHRTPLGAIAAPTSATSVTDAIASLGGITAVSEVLDVDLGSAAFNDTSRLFDVVLVGRSAGGVTFLSASQSSDSVTQPITSSTYPDPERRTAPDEIFGAVAIDGASVVVRQQVAGTTQASVYDLAYLNSLLPSSSGIPSGQGVGMQSAEGWIVLNDPADLTQSLLWHYGDFQPGTVGTPDRTGEVSVAIGGASSFLAVYPAGNEIHVRQFDCPGSCFPAATPRIDLRTDATSVAWARVTQVGGTPLVLSGETVGGTTRVVARVLGTDLHPLVWPSGGSALVLDSFEGGATASGRATRANDGAGSPHAVLAWTTQPAAGDHTARLADLRIACP